MVEYSDSDLVQRASRGESKAFDVLVHKYWEWAFAIAYGLVDDFSAAQDIAQEAFVNSWQKLYQLNRPERFKQWLRQIVMNQAMMYLRSKKSTVSLDEIEDAAITHSEGPEEKIIKQETIESLNRAMQNLNPRHRLLLALFYMDGLSQRDIGSLLEIPESTVKSRLSDARARIRKEISVGSIHEKRGSAVVSLRGVNLRPLEEDSPWLEDIDLDVNEGELLVLTGPQYCGKYELLKMIGLLEKPDSGVVEVNGIDTSELDPLKFLEIKVGMFGYIWQQPQLSQHMSAVENVVLPLIAAGIERASCIERSIEALRFVGINGEKRELPVRLLSLRDRQKIALARALVVGPDVVIAQEATRSPLLIANH